MSERPTDSDSASGGPWRHIPNGLTVLRLLVALYFPFAPQSYHLYLIAVGLATEFLDGFIARLQNWTSYLGQVLDPVADKLLVLSVSLTWVWLDKLSLVQWLLLATRDFGVLFIALVLLARGKAGSVKSLKARFPSKVTTALQYAAFLLILADLVDYLTPLILATAVLGAVAAAQYAHLLRDELLKR